jgi:hypothetical protein
MAQGSNAPARPGLNTVSLVGFAKPGAPVPAIWGTVSVPVIPMFWGS